MQVVEGSVDPTRMLIFVHGVSSLCDTSEEKHVSLDAVRKKYVQVCESADTITAARLAEACVARNWELCVVELEGHGLSSGERCVCPSFHRLVDQVTEVVRELRKKMRCLLPRSQQFAGVAGGATLACVTF